MKFSGGRLRGQEKAKWGKSMGLDKKAKWSNTDFFYVGGYRMANNIYCP